MEKKYTVEEVKQKIEDYFNRKPCRIRDEDGNPVPATQSVDMYDMKPPTITGLIRQTIGRSAWENYKKDPDYTDILVDAEDRVEEWHEARLSGSNAQGSIFYLKNRGRNWRDESSLLSPQPVAVVAMSLDKENENLFQKNLEAFFGSNTRTTEIN